MVRFAFLWLGLMAVVPAGFAQVSATHKVVSASVVQSVMSETAGAPSLELMAASSKAGYPAYAGDVDIDYLRIVQARNTEAIEMSKVLLKHSAEADVRMMAGDILKARDAESRMIAAWLAKHGPQAAPVAAKPVVKDGIPALQFAMEQAVDTSPTSPTVAVPASPVAPSATVIPVALPVSVPGTAAKAVVVVPAAVVVSTGMVVSGTDAAPAYAPGTVYGIPAPNEAIISLPPKMELLETPSTPAAPVSATVSPL